MVTGDPCTSHVENEHENGVSVLFFEPGLTVTLDLTTFRCPEDTFGVSEICCVQCFEHLVSPSLTLFEVFHTNHDLKKNVANCGTTRTQDSDQTDIKVRLSFCLAQEPFDLLS